MPVDPIFLQQRLAPIGRIRAGKQIVTKNGKTAPTRLEQFRLTTPYRWAADSVAEHLGGTVEPWANDLTNDRWQVETEADSLDVVVLPAPMPGESAVSQWFEQWGKGGCTHRCTGSQAYIAGGHTYIDPIPCDGTKGTCGTARDKLDEQEAEGVPERDRVTACSLKTRLSVLLPSVVGTGQWRIDTASWNAGMELGGISDWLVRATAAGYSIEATLSLLPQTRRRYVKGEPKTFHFIMPTLVAKMSQRAVLEIERGGAYRPELDGHQPMPIERRRPLQLEPGHADTPPPRAPRGRYRTVDTVVPPVGIDPPTVVDAEVLEDEHDAAAERSAWFAALPTAEQNTIDHMFALCAQRLGACYDDTNAKVHDRVRRGLEQISSGELRIVIAEHELQLTRIPSGDIALSLCVDQVVES